MNPMQVIVASYNCVIFFEALFDQKDETKLNVSAFIRRADSMVIFVVNIHAGYGPSNESPKIYEQMALLLNRMPNLIIAGDFNVQEAKRDWFTPLFPTQREILLTPEPEEIGNPTWDAVFMSPSPDSLFNNVKTLAVEAALEHKRRKEEGSDGSKLPSSHQLLMRGL